MANKFWFLIGNSLKKKLKSKWFLVINLLLCIGIVGIINIDTIIKAFGGEFDEANEVMVIDNTGYYNVFSNNLNSINEQLDMGYTFKITRETKTLDVLEEEIKGTDKVVVVLDNSDDEYIKASIVSESNIDTIYYQMLYQSLTTTKSQVALSLSNIDQEELARVTSPITIDRVILDENKTSEGENMDTIMSTVFPAVILPVFILVIFVVQMIGAEINEEKQTRSMEVIISNVSPKAHFFSKVIASNAFVLLQGALLIGFMALGFLVRSNTATGASSSFTLEISGIWDTLVQSGFVDKLPVIIPVTLILMVLSFLAYSLLAGILASMTVSMEDYQQIQTPIMMICLLGYYLAIMAGVFEGSVLIKTLACVPFISCLLLPALLVIGQVGVVHTVISVVALGLLNFILIKFGLKIYKIGILNYSTDKMWSKIFKAFKSKEV